MENLQDGTLNLQLPAGNYTTKWTDPISGKVEKPQKIRHKGGIFSLAMPSGTLDKALHIQAAQ